MFLPITLFFYYLNKKKYQNFILLIASLIFYACGEPKMVLLMIASIICNYCFAIGIEKYKRYKKAIFIVSIIYNLGVLFIFKYLGFSMSILNSLLGINLKIVQIALPIGISFYTFQAMSYVIDVYNNNNIEAQYNILDLGLYISLFPQLIAGPIVRYNSIATQIKTRNISLRFFGQGSKCFICGFCKKVILSNNLSVVAGHYFGNQPMNNSVLGAWLGVLCFSLQIYYDFSGYSNMAIGLGKMFGFDFEENFNYPYISKSITDFWRRWHISLSRWFRDYVYIPLGGSRVTTSRHILNMAVVWILTGIWHGAAYSFVAWGIMYFVALIVEKYIIKPEEKNSFIFKVLYKVIILLYINFGWVIFNANGLKMGIKYCLSMIKVYYNNPIIDATSIWLFREYKVFIILAILFSMPVAPWMVEKMKRYSFANKLLIPAGYLVGFMWSISFLILGAHNPFIYFNF